MGYWGRYETSNPVAHTTLAENKLRQMNHEVNTLTNINFIALAICCFDTVLINLGDRALGQIHIRQ